MIQYSILFYSQYLFIYQRKFRNLTSDYTESCQVSKHGCSTAEMFYGTDAGHEGVWRVGLAPNAVFFHNFVAPPARKVSSEKRGGAEDGLPKMLAKFAPRCGVRAIWMSKLLKRGMPGALFEVELYKICTPLWREGDFEVNIVKNWRFQSTFGSWAPQILHHAVARERFGSRNR